MAGVSEVLAVLEAAGYQRLPKPLTVVGTEFDFEAAASGVDNSNDLVLIATSEVPLRRLQRLVAGLTRSLDLAASKRPVSLILLGGVALSERFELERYARVLPISSGWPSTAEIQEAIAVLLPLKLPNADLVHAGDPINEVMAVLGPQSVTSDQVALIAAAADGPDAVREALRRYVNRGAGWTDLEGDNDA